MFAEVWNLKVNTVFFRILHFHTNYYSVPTKRGERGVIIIGGSEVTSGSKPVRGAIQGQK